MSKKIAVVQFEGTYHKTYDFKNVFEELEIGDKVVVDTVNGLSIVDVIDFKEASSKATKYIVQKIDLASHEKRIEEEERKEELKLELEKRKQELEQLEVYRALASKDEKMKQLLEEYEGLKVE